MLPSEATTDFADINGAHLYYELAGSGPPLVMLHAGVADSRQWNNEFPHLSKRRRVLRYDLRGYGRSEPVEGDFSHLQDLVALLDALRMREPAVLIGCSMGGGVALDFALQYPDRVYALILVGAGPSGLKLDVPKPPQYDRLVVADEAGDLDLVAELETQIWFDGMGRTPQQVDPVLRRLAFDMNRNALALDARKLGTRLADSAIPAAEHLQELHLPVLIIVGEHDTPFILAAADYMEQRLPSARQVMIADTAHMANLDHPGKFRELVTQFLEEIPAWYSAHPAATPPSGGQ